MTQEAKQIAASYQHMAQAHGAAPSVDPAAAAHYGNVIPRVPVSIYPGGGEGGGRDIKVWCCGERTCVGPFSSVMYTSHGGDLTWCPKHRPELSCYCCTCM